MARQGAAWRQGAGLRREGLAIVMGQKDSVVIGPWLYKKLPWDPTKDLTAVAHVAYTPVVIATSANSKYKTMADVIAVAESGFKDFDVSTWYGVFAPAGTPASVVTALNAEINKLMVTADTKAAIQAQGAEPEAMSAAQFGTLMKNDYAKWKGIVEASGAKIE